MPLILSLSVFKRFIITLYLIITVLAEDIKFEDSMPHPNVVDPLDYNKDQKTTPLPNPEKLEHPAEKLENLTRDIKESTRDNPFYKLPALDNIIRKLSESLGVYVTHNDKMEHLNFESQQREEMNEEESDHDFENNEEKFDWFEKSELLDAMTPEEKLNYIPNLKDAISHEIELLKNKLESLKNSLEYNIKL